MPKAHAFEKEITNVPNDLLFVEIVSLLNAGTKILCVFDC